MTLSTLAIGLGLLFAIPQVLGLLKPGTMTAWVRSFPRSETWGYVLMGLGTAWFLWNVSKESISDFAAYKRIMLIGFGAVGVLSCLYVKDFLAVRGLAVVFLLLAKLMLDTARLNDSPWRLVIALWAYGLVLAGMWFIVSPWRFRDLVQWCTATEKRLQTVSAVRLIFFLGVVLLGLTAFRG